LRGLLRHPIKQRQVTRLVLGPQGYAADLAIF